MPKFTYEEHLKRMRDMLKPKDGARPLVLQQLLDRAKKKALEGTK